MDEEVYISFRKKIGANFGRIRKQRKLSLREVEAITGIGHSWIGKFEKGLVNFEIDTLITLAANFEFSLKELFDFSYKFPTDR